MVNLFCVFEFLIWSNFNVFKLNYVGFKLDYFLLIEVVGEKIEKIDYEDIEFEIVYWSFVIVCYVLGVNFFLCVFNGFIYKIWGKYGI